MGYQFTFGLFGLVDEDIALTEGKLTKEWQFRIVVPQVDIAETAADHHGQHPTWE